MNGYQKDIPWITSSKLPSQVKGMCCCESFHTVKWIVNKRDSCFGSFEANGCSLFNTAWHWQIGREQWIYDSELFGGEDASEVLPSLSEQQQHSIGLQAGVELKLIHQLPVAKQAEAWYIRKSKKHRRYVDRYKACPVVMERDQHILSFIDEHLGWMKGRADGFQHDDFHPVNLVVNKDELAGVIDFNRADQGDPAHEFLKLGLFATEISIPYSIGQVQGYFDGREPDEGFWNMYSLYMAMALVSSVVWIQSVKPEETDQMMEKIERVREDHDDFRRLIPKWYTVYR